MDSMMRIAFIDNVSSAAYTALPPPFPAAWENATPTETCAALLSGQADAGLLSTVRLPEAEAFLEPAGPFGIACQGPASSVMFFSRRPLETLIKDREPVYVSEESQTSRRLLRLLCIREFGAAPVLSPDVAHAEGILRIGNRALDASLPEQRWPIRIDLGQWWHSAMGLPFVFARWVVRKDLLEERKTQLIRWLDATVAASQTPEGRARMARRHAGVFADQEQANFYYGHLQHRLTHAHRAGIRAFLKLERDQRPCPVLAEPAELRLPCELTA